MFLKLTTTDGGKKRARAEAISIYCSEGAGSTLIATDARPMFWVLETPEEIDEMLEACTGGVYDLVRARREAQARQDWAEANDARKAELLEVLSRGEVDP